MGRSLVSALPLIPEGELVLAVDAKVEAAEKLAAEFGCEATSDLHGALAREDLDAVIIATPNNKHPEHAILAARAGKHVLTEKPMALHAEDAVAMIRAAHEARVKLMVAQVLRYVTPFVWMIEQIKGGAWGEPFSGQVTRLSGGWTGGSYDEPWRHSMAESGGALFEIHVHEIDFMCCVFGRPEAVWAVTGQFFLDDVDYYDTAEVLVRFEGGKPVQFFTGNCAIEGVYDGKILCTGANAYFNRGTGQVHVRLADGTVIEPNAQELAAAYEPGVKREVREFVEAVAYDRPVTIPGEEGLRVVEIAEGAILAGEQGEVISLPLVQV